MRLLPDLSKDEELGPCCSGWLPLGRLGFLSFQGGDLLRFFQLGIGYAWGMGTKTMVSMLFVPIKLSIGGGGNAD